MYHLRKGLLLIFCLAAFGNAAELLPGEQKQMAAHPALMGEVLKARALLDQVELSANRSAMIDANQTLRQVLVAAPEFAPAHREFSRVFYLNSHRFGFLDKRDHSHIWRSLKLAEKFDGDYAQLAYDIARASVYRRDFEQARVLIREIDVSENPQSLLLLKLDLLIAEKDYASAREQLAELQRTRGSYSDFPFRAAVVFRYLGDYKNAEIMIQDAIDQGHDRKEVYMLWFWICLNDKRPEDALSKLNDLRHFGLSQAKIKNYTSRAYDVWASNKLRNERAEEAIKFIEKVAHFGGSNVRVAYLKRRAFQIWSNQLILAKRFDDALIKLAMAEENGMPQKQVHSYEKRIARLKARQN
ncbi:Uncharacterised protein [BD1-7 clade bacterium]|uniref:Beta-barrel assembly-enhancing protease n=1 Tax=BD1-7 clade bacterium TaxID=2029982 RepID=A0A5S9NJK7_9GAMM|nr:Uncharacterised protein [BD1-7 clade bacterium]CAA0093381.1 Uncharacterised protein [BD1-7 clade bacterium]